MKPIMKPILRIAFSTTAAAAGLLLAFFAAFLATRRASPPRPAAAPLAQDPAATASPPRLAPETSAAPKLETESIVRDPRAPHYDASKLLFALALPARQVWESEPQDLTWAPPMEQFMTETLRNDILQKLPEITLDDVVCKTAMCRFEIRGDPVQMKQASSLVSQLSMSESTTVSGGSPDHRVFYATFSPEERDLEAARRLYQEKRRFKLTKLRERPDLVSVLPGP
jgi:hypothetical protein